MESRTYHNVGLDACRSVRACGAGLFVTADATATSDRFGRECVCVCVHMCVCVCVRVCVCVFFFTFPSVTDRTLCIDCCWCRVCAVCPDGTFSDQVRQCIQLW